MIDGRKLRRAIDNALNGAAKAVKVDLDTTTQSWKSRPEFTIDRTADGRIVATDDEVFQYVDAGTRPHVITARNKPVLTFGVGGSPKTTPRVIGSKPGTKGRSIVRAKQVHHPGSAPREFTDTVKEKWDDELPVTLQRAIDAIV